MIICLCKNVNLNQISKYIEDSQQSSKIQLLKNLQKDLKVATDCGCCLDCVRLIIESKGVKKQHI